MADTIIQYDFGGANTLQLYAEGSDTVANTGGDTGVAETNRTTTYKATVAEALTGWYRAYCLVGTVSTSIGWVYITADDTNTYRVRASKEAHFERYRGPSGFGIYYDDEAANTTTILGVDGTVDNPVSTIAAVNTLASALFGSGVPRVYFTNDSSGTLAASIAGWSLIGLGPAANNVVTLNNQTTTEAQFENLGLTGQQNGNVTAFRCVLSAVTDLFGWYRDCQLFGTNALSTTNTSYFFNCSCNLASPIIITYTATASAVFYDWQGQMRVDTMAAGNNLMVSGEGAVTFHTDCTGGTATLYGDIDVTDNSGGAVTITQYSSLTNDVTWAEDQAPKHSLGAVVMIATNADTTTNAGKLTAFKPSDDSEFQQYTLTTDADADPTTGVS